MTIHKNRQLVMLALTVLVLSCQKNESRLLSDNASRTIGFSVYSASMTTKGTAVSGDDIFGAVSSEGIGVFAFMQPNVNGTAIDFNSRKFSTPDFMYNQKVGNWTAGDPGSWSWTYSPVKYWPNEENDQVSFFAYAPYNALTRWEDLCIATNTAGTILTTSVPVYDLKSDMQDVLWADPQLNMKGLPTPTTVNFSFRHLLSKVSIKIGVNDGSGNPKAWTDATTTIIVDRIVFTSLADSYNLSCPLPISESESERKAAWKAGRTTQNVVLLRDSDFCENSEINSTRFSTPESKTLLSEEGGSVGYLFLAPQVFKDGVQTIAITYTVTSIDSVNPPNSSVKTNTITKNLSQVFPLVTGSASDHGIESGKAYCLNFLLSLESVSLEGGVTNWGSETVSTTVL